MLTIDTIEIVTDETITEALARPGLTVIDFWAPWCAPCRAMAPQFERAAQSRPEYRFAKVNVDEQPVLAARFGIRSIPTLVVLRDGEPVAAEAGVIGAVELVGALDRIAAQAPAAAGVR
jgi:thioredoxin